jgi:hypothetical protein
VVAIFDTGWRENILTTNVTKERTQHTLINVQSTGHIPQGGM